MTAKKTPATDTAATETTPAAAPKVRKTRTPKPVNDLPSAVAALERAKARQARTSKASVDAQKEAQDARVALVEAKATVERFYNDLVGVPGEDVQDAPAELPGELQGDDDMDVDMGENA